MYSICSMQDKARSGPEKYTRCIPDLELASKIYHCFARADTGER